MPRKRRGPIYWLRDLPETCARQAQSGRVSFMVIRMLPSAIFLSAILMARSLGYFTAQTFWFVGTPTAIGALCVFLITVRDLQKWRSGSPSSSDVS